MTIVIAVIAGLAIGALMGALGGGGAVVAVPLFVYVFAFDSAGATSSSLLIVAIGAAFGVLSHARRRNVRVGHGLVFGALGIGGAAVGTRLAHQVSQPVLLSAFAALLLVVAATMARSAVRTGTGAGAGSGDGEAPDGRGREPADGNAQPASASRSRVRPGGDIAPPSVGGTARPVRRWVGTLGAASVVGILTGFFGVGGGFVVVPALTLVLGLEMAVAVGTSLLVILINTASALVVRGGVTGVVDMPLVWTVAGAAIVGTAVGAAIGDRLPERVLRLGFAGFLVLVSAYTAYQSVPALLP